MSGGRRAWLAGMAALSLWLCSCVHAPPARPPTEEVTVALQTALGRIVVVVYPTTAPLSAGDFLAYVDAGLYQNAAFFRTVRSDNDHGEPTIQVVQVQLPDKSKSRPPIAHESTQLTGLRHVDGALSLARTAVDTGSAASFFICIGEQPALDYGGKRNPDGQGFAVFGRVISGMEIVRRIQAMSSDGATENPYTKGQILNKPIPIVAAFRL